MLFKLTEGTPVGGGGLVGNASRRRPSHGSMEHNSKMRRGGKVSQTDGPP